MTCPSNPNLTADQLRDLLAYDEPTGLFFWQVKPRKGVQIGDVAGYIDPRGYVLIKVAGFRIYAHRLAWLFSTGEWPSQDIDHRDGDKSNNRIGNLRDVSKNLNAQNIAAAFNSSKVGLLGVSPSGKKFQARIYTNNKQRCLGSFLTPEEAHAAYLTAKREIHPGMVEARYGFPVENRPEVVMV